jgi:glycosyltransferase involved in cell wall biosynthesis
MHSGIKIREPKISVVSFCFNDENNIEKYIKEFSFAHEILFLDNNSTDKTVEIAQKLGATVIQQTSDNKAEQQKIAVVNAQNNWILLADLNEIFSPQLKKEILLEISNPKKSSVYFIKQTLIFFGKRIKYGAYYNKKKMLLFNKSIFANSDVSKIAFTNQNSATSRTLKNTLDSRDYKSFDDFNSRLNFLRKEEALVLFDKNIKPNFYHFFIKPLSNFLNQYFIKFGFIDGKEGFILASVNSFSILKRYLILWLLYFKME